MRAFQLVLLGLFLLSACGEKDDTAAVDADGDGFTAAEDCNDASSAIHPGAEERCNGLDDDCDGLQDEDDPDLASPLWYPDADDDGYGHEGGASVVACDQPSGHTAEGGDCDDGDPAVHPGASEWCDGIDNDCDEVVDEDDAVDAPGWYPDVDGDGYGDLDATPTPACSQPTGMAAEGSDCDDDDATVHPGAEEWCDEADTDCDGEGFDDESSDAPTWFADADSDGYGDAASPATACEQPTDRVADASDCDDGDDAIHPGATEYCDGVDSDCDGVLDEDDASDAPSWYADADGDGYGDPATGSPACSQPSGTVADASDCDDANAATHPGAEEWCDTVDSDCDGVSDDDDSNDALLWYADADADGFGDASSSRSACSQPSGHVAEASDCDDSRADAHPGANEWCDGIDNDCDGSADESDAIDASPWYADVDGDGWGVASTTVTACSAPPSFVADSGDCADGDAAIFPGADEWCDGVDSDCDGTVDEDDALDASTFYADRDSDGFGDIGTTTTACSAPSGYIADDSDCDDSKDSVHPGADEHCDGLDEDCDGVADNNAVDEPSWYDDGDGDGWGDPATAFEACTAPSGMIAYGEDCDDGDPTIHPGATEYCDAIDSDCDGSSTVGAVDGSTWYSDSDGDGYGDASAPVTDCSQPTGTVVDDSDCDDSKDSVHPGADEHCDGIDEDCDGVADEGAIDEATWYTDADGDGHGDASSSTTACTAPSGTVADDSDCDDSDPALTDDCSGCGTLTTYPGTVLLTGFGSASDASSFCDHYNAIAGDLQVDNSDLVDFENLGCLCEVEGDVSVSDNSVLESFEGLDYLSSIGGDLLVETNNPLLVDYTGLDGLAVIGGSLDTLETFDPAGLSGLVSVGGSLDVAVVTSSDLSGLASLESVDGDLRLVDVPSFVGLERLDTVSGDLVISHATASELTGMDSLVSVGGDLILNQTDSLTDLTGLGSLSTIGGVLVLQYSELTDLQGTALSSVGALALTGTTLEDFQGLESITSLDGGLNISSSTLGSFAGLELLETIGGRLYLYGSGGFTDLSGLDSVTSIADHLDIEYCSDLTSLQGLWSLDSIGDDLQLDNNAGLSSHAGLESLRSIGGNLLQSSTTSGGHMSFAGLDNLATVGGYLGIYGSSSGLDALETVGSDAVLYGASGSTPLPALVGVGGDLEIWYHSSSIGGFDSLESVSGHLTFCENSGSTISGFPVLTSLGSYLQMDGNDGLTYVTGLGSLVTINGTLSIDGNINLASITGFDVLAHIGALELTDNEDLTNIDGLMSLDTVAGNFYVGWNGLSRSQAEALRDAIGVSDIGGTITIYE